MKSFLSFFWEFAKIVIIAALIVLPIRYFVFQPFLVHGPSMEPNFENGDYLIIDELSYRLREPQRGEVVVFNYPLDPSQRYIKRIIGLPGETVMIEEGRIYINEDILDESEYLASSVYTLSQNGKETVLSENEYYVLGDHRSASSDSRRWGVLDKEDLIGRAFFKVNLFDEFSKVNSPSYSQ